MTASRRFWPHALHAINSFPLRAILITLAFFALILAAIFAFWYGWFDLWGQPMHRVRELREPAIERQHQIEDLSNP